MFKTNGETTAYFFAKRAIYGIVVLCFCLAGLSAHLLSDSIWDIPTENSPFVLDPCEDSILAPSIQPTQYQRQITSISITRYIFQLSPLLSPLLHPPQIA